MLLFFNQSINPKLVQALGWTLVHSLWQGIIIAFLAGLVILLTKRSGAALRYNLLVFLLFAFAAGITGSFIYEWNQSSPAPKTVSAPSVNNGIINTDPLKVTLLQHPSPDSFTLFRAFFNENMPAIVLVWALIFLFQFTRLLAGLHHIHTLRRRKIMEVSANWKEKLLELSWAMGIGKGVTLLESAMVQVPITIGHLKPVILLPVGLLTNLSVEQVESILIHELAHIHRKDYAVNLVQSFMETVFFFNPALWWISSLIREEREACCDDIVIAYSSDRETYLRALVSFHEMPANLPAPVLALANRKYYLLNRVKRMLTHENQTLNFMERTILIGSIIALSAFAFLPSSGQQKKSKKPVVQKTEQRAAPADEVSSAIKPTIALTAVAWADEPAPSLVPTTVINAKTAAEPVPATSVTPSTAPVRAIAVGPDTIPGSGSNATRFTNVSVSTNDNNGKVTSETTAITENGDAYKLNIADGEVTFFSVNGRSIPLSELGNYENIIQSIKNRTKKNKTKVKSSCTEGSNSHSEAHTNCNTEENTNTTVNANSNYRTAAAGGTRQSTNVNTNSATNTIKSIVDEMITKNIIESKDYVNFTLQENELIVNGVKQNPSVASHFTNKFNIKKGDMINVVINGGSTTSSIRRN